MTPSSTDLHPRHGARFVFTRVSETHPAYAVTVYLADGRTLASQLAWDELGHACLSPALEVEWADDETRKFARALKQRPKQKLVRWRDASGP